MSDSNRPGIWSRHNPSGRHKARANRRSEGAGERYINPGNWSPLIYNFRHYYRLAPEELGKTFRAEI